AQRMLLWRADAGAIGLLEKMVVESKNTLARLHALCALVGAGESSKLKGVTGRAALAEASPVVRGQAVRDVEPILAESVRVGERAGEAGRPPSAGVVAGLLRTARGTGRVGAIGAPLEALSRPADGKCATWQFQAVGHILDSR